MSADLTTWTTKATSRLNKMFDSKKDETYDLLQTCVGQMRLQNPPIFATFQAGVPKEFLEYFWDLPTTIEVPKPVWITDFEKLPKEPSILILTSVDPLIKDEETILPMIRQQKHSLMLVSNIEALLSTEHRDWFLKKIDAGEIKILNFSLTPHDFKNRVNSIFQCPDNRMLQHLVDRGGIPLAMLHLSQFDKEVLDVILYRKGANPVRTLLRHLFTMACKSFNIQESWKFEGFSYITLAKMVGLYVINTHDHFFGSRDATVQATVTEEPSFRIVWPERLKQRFVSLDPAAMKLLPGPGLEAPSAMEYFIAQNLSCPFNVNLTLGERFKSLRHTFVANCAYPRERPIMVPKVVTEAKKRNLEWTPDQLERMAEMHTDNLTELVHRAPSGQMMVFRPQSHSPDMMAVYHSIDARARVVTHHILAIQAKSGLEEDINDLKLQREMGKCPLTQVVDCPSFVQVGFTQSDGMHRYTLTFVLAAMKCDKLREYLEARSDVLIKNKSLDEGYLHCTHNSWKHLPAGVDVVVLTQVGLIELLGSENFDFLKKYKASNVLDNQAENYLVSGVPGSPSSISTDATPSINANLLRGAINGLSEEDKDKYVPRMVEHFKRLVEKSQRVVASSLAGSPECPLDNASVSLSDDTQPKRPFSEVAGDGTGEPSPKKRKTDAGSKNTRSVRTQQSSAIAEMPLQLEEPTFAGNDESEEMKEN